MHVGFYNPYFDTLGGGERYVLSLASHLSRIHDVDVLWDDPALLQKAVDRYGFNLSKVNVVPNFFASDPLPVKLYKSRMFDLFFFFTDGSIPTTLAKRNILMFEIPFQHVVMPVWKLRLFSRIVSISEFTKTNLPPPLGEKSVIIYPPVDVDLFKPGKKDKIILSVGRFGSHPTKKHTTLVQSFGEFSKKVQGFTLIIAGGLHQSDKAYFNELQESARGLPVDFLTNISFKDLRALYARAPIYWHAAGYGETNPEYMEHFGITPVEAMASGAIPLAFRGGGLPEIIDEGVNGFLWETPEELVAKTVKVLRNPQPMEAMGQNAILKSRRFHPGKFYTAFDDLIRSL